MTKYRICPNIWTIRSLVDHLNNGVQCRLPDGRCVPSRPLGLDTFPARFKAAWLVFTGKADAVTWDDPSVNQMKAVLKHYCKNGGRNKTQIRLCKDLIEIIKSEFKLLHQVTSR